MATVRLDSFHFDLPADDDCWHLNDPRDVTIRRRLPAALAQAPLYVATPWDDFAGTPGLREAPLRYATAEVDEPSDTYRRVGINARAVWKETRGKGVKVVIFDNGVDFQHPSLYANVSLDDARDFDFDFGNGGRSYAEGGRIDNPFNAHGTACAGIVAAARLPGIRVVGVAPEATLVPIRISTNFETRSLINALEYAGGVGDVILIPRYLPESDALSATISRIAQQVPIVCAAGNDGTDFMVYPASLKETIAVGACNEKGYRSTYSQYGEGLDMVAVSNDLANEDATVIRLDLDEANFRVRAEEERQARLANRPLPPARPRDLRELKQLPQTAGWNLDRFGSLSIATTDHRGDFGYNDEPAGDFCLATGDVGFGGTSAAAAQVAGVIALMLGACLEKHGVDRVKEHLKPDAIRSILKENTSKTCLHPEPGRTFEAEFGAGLVDAAAAVEAALAAC